MGDLWPRFGISTVSVIAGRYCRIATYFLVKGGIPRIGPAGGRRDGSSCCLRPQEYGGVPHMPVPQPHRLLLSGMRHATRAACGAARRRRQRPRLQHTGCAVVAIHRLFLRAWSHEGIRTEGASPSLRPPLLDLGAAFGNRRVLDNAKLAIRAAKRAGSIVEAVHTQIGPLLWRERIEVRRMSPR